jgi:hypothetical protein
MSPLQVLINEYQAAGQPLPPWLPKIAGAANVQLATIQSGEIQNAHLNFNAYQRDQQAMKDWQTNVERLTDIGGLSIPPQPLPSPKIIDKVVYATAEGIIETGPDAGNGQYVAWMWQEWGS